MSGRRVGFTTMVRRWLPGLLSLLLLVAACGDDAATPTTTATTAASTTTPAVTTTTPAVTTTTEDHVTIDELLALCPTAPQIAMLDADFDIQFLDATGTELVCTAADGSADLTRVQERIYQAVLTTTELKFDAPLPWTELTLYAWLKESLAGIRVSSEFTAPGFGAVPGYVDIPASGVSAYLTLRWIDPQIGTGMDALVGLIVTYAGYMSSTGPECIGGEPAGNEEGAAGYFFMSWLADHSNPEFLTAGDVPPSYYRDTARDAAEQARLQVCGG